MNNSLYFQSGGVTAVIGATAAALIEAHQRYGSGTLFAAENGLQGVISEKLVNASSLNPVMRSVLGQVPGGGLGSGRVLLKPYQEDPQTWERVRDVLTIYKINTIYVNGGNGSMDTAAKLVELGHRYDLSLHVIGLPKTIDNDLEGTDTSPGFGSALKYLSVSLMEAARDHYAMSLKPSVFILEVMGRHTGWLATCGAMARFPEPMARPLIAFPEVVFNADNFMGAVQASFRRKNACVCVISEGVRTHTGDFFAQWHKDTLYGREQLGGAGMALASMMREKLGVKVHVAVPNYLQRAAAHLVSATDIAQAEAVALFGVQLAQQGANGVMVNIVRDATDPYQWHCDSVDLEKVANKERLLPESWIDQKAYTITPEAQRYLKPLIQGEVTHRWKDGLPDYPWIQWPVSCS